MATRIPFTSLHFGMKKPFQAPPNLDLTKPGVPNDHPEIHQAPGALVILAGPSGVGKGTARQGVLLDAELQQNVVGLDSYKTRPPRPGEENPESGYRHLPLAEFETLKSQNQLFQYTEYCGNFMATLLKDVVTRLNEGKVVLFEATAEVALQIKHRYVDKVTTVFIAPEHREALLAQLRQRNTETEAEIQKRYQKADEELQFQPYFDQVIVSKHGQIAGLVQQLKEILQQVKIPH